MKKFSNRKEVIDALVRDFGSNEKSYNNTPTNKQREKFLSIIQPALIECPNLLVHADNSSSLQSMYHDSPFNGIRIGLLQFGIAPPRGSALADISVEPVLSFHSRLALIKELPKGASLSYGCEKILQQDSMIGLVAAGYGDAIPLHCGGKARGLKRTFVGEKSIRDEPYYRQRSSPSTSAL